MDVVQEFESVLLIMNVTQDQKSNPRCNKRLKDKFKFQTSIKHSVIAIITNHKQLIKSRNLCKLKQGPVPYGVDEIEMRQRNKHKSGI